MELSDNACFVALDQPVKLQVVGETDIGSMREENEDSFGTLELPDGYFMTVCDGMGGYAGGRIASQTAVATLVAYIQEHHDPERIHDVLRAGVTAANNAVRAKARADSRLGEMGTTCVAALVCAGQYYVIHVGDSRAYHFRDGRFALKTEDHTVVQQLINQGRLDPLDAANHPSAGILVRCLGQLDEITADISGPFPFEDGDRLLLCSDGLSGMLYEDDIARVLTGQDPLACIQALIKYANEAGGFDNITAVVAQRGEWPAEAISWSIAVDSAEGVALAAAETQERPPQALSPDVGHTRNTLIMAALTLDDTRELEPNTHLDWEPGRERLRKIAITTAILLTLVLVAIVILLRQV